jgi:hypothetical protein
LLGSDASDICDDSAASNISDVSIVTAESSISDEFALLTSAESVTFDDFNISRESVEPDIYDKYASTEFTEIGITPDFDDSGMLPESTETAELLICDDSETSVSDELGISDVLDICSEFDEPDTSDRSALLESTELGTFDSSAVFNMSPASTETAKSFISDDSETFVSDESSISDDSDTSNVFVETDTSDR